MTLTRATLVQSTFVRRLTGSLTRVGAVGAGVLLFALPFLQSGFGETHGHGAGPHMDHTAHHGGSLWMVGDNHLEVVEGAHTLEVYVSDAERRPLHALAASVVFDDDEPRPLAWSGYRLVAPRPEHYAWADYRITLADQPPLAVKLAASTPGVGS